MMLSRHGLFRGNTLLWLLLCWLLLLPRPVAAMMTEPVEELMATAYPAGEVLRYNVTWMGLRAGELTFEIKPLDDQGELLALEISARTAGMLGRVYPVRDDFRVVVQGPARLPRHYRIDEHKREPRRSRSTIYDQENGRIIYHRSKDEVREYSVEGPVHNEFSAFFAMRVMPFGSQGNKSEQVVIPTFADERRNLVQVQLVGRDIFQTVVGRQDYLLVRPRLDFVGLYEKAGDPEIWLTDDRYRIPVRVRSRIAIGSLVATLQYYKGPAGEFSR